MKTILKLSMMLLTLVMACSSDDNSDSNSNEIQTQLLGKWFFENPNNNPTINNSFTFTTEGNVTYSYWDGTPQNTYDSETGTFSFNGDIMTMIFPEDVSLTFVQKVVFINDNVVEFLETGVSGENAYDGDYFREGASTYESPDGTLKEYQISFSGYSSSSQQYPISIEYYVDDDNGLISTQTINSQTNTDIIQSINIESVDRIGFKYDVTNYEESLIEFVEIKNLETNEVIFTSSILEIEDNEVFTYDISENSYTIQ